MKEGGGKRFRKSPAGMIREERLRQSVCVFFSFFISEHVRRTCPLRRARGNSDTRGGSQATAQTLGVTQVFPQEWVGGRLRGCEMDRFQF